ncbi:MAG: low molecular weight phosphatase family protein [Hyphomicrobiaceae bacterium]|nr:low molecular weight phosphatase family protein [Hyphomicrobiaceae bacterium]
MAGETAQKPRNVLFACSLNAVRSPMAAAMLRHLAGEDVGVASAGVRAGLLDPMAVRVMSEIGIDVSQHQPCALRDLDEPDYDLVVSLSPEAHHQALELTRTMPADVEYWPTLDATVVLGHGDEEQVLASYRMVRDHLFRRIKQRFGFLGGPSV